MRFNAKLFFCLIFLAVAFIPQNPDMWMRQTWLGAIASSCFLGFFVYKKFSHWLPGVCFAYFCAHSALGWANPYVHDFWGIGRTFVCMLAGNSFAFLVSVTLPVLLLQKKYRPIDWLPILAIGSSLIMIGKKLLGFPVYSFMNVGSADAAMLASIYPLVFGNKNIPKFVKILPLVAIVLSGSTTGMVLLFLNAIFFLRSKLVFLVAASSIFFLRHSPFVTEGRWPVWKMVADEWWRNCDRWLGIGSGMFFLFGPKVQTTNFNGVQALFLFAHNEYLQITIEQGIIGIILFTATGFLALKKSLNRPYLFASIATFGVSMLAQFPFRFFISAVVAAILIREAFDDGRGQTVQN